MKASCQAIKLAHTQASCPQVHAMQPIESDFPQRILLETAESFPIDGSRIGRRHVCSGCLTRVPPFGHNKDPSQDFDGAYDGDDSDSKADPGQCAT